MVPSTDVMLRVGSFVLAFFGRTRKDQELPFASAGRKSFVLKRIFEVSLVIAARRLIPCPFDIVDLPKMIDKHYLLGSIE